MYRFYNSLLFLNSEIEKKKRASEDLKILYSVKKSEAKKKLS